MKICSALKSAIVACLLWIPSSADARLLGGSGVAPPSPSISQMNVDAPGSNTFINALHGCGYYIPNNSDLAHLAADGYPNGSGVNLNCGPSTLSPGVSYTLLIPATRAGVGGNINISFADGQFSGCTAAVNVTVTGCAGGNTNITVVTAGQAASVQMTPATASLTLWNFNNGVTGSGEIALLQTSNVASFTTGEYVTAAAISTYSTPKPRALRFMPMINIGPANLNGESAWANRRQLTNLTWIDPIFPPGILAPSAATGTDAYTVSGAPNTPSSLTDGEQIIVAFTNPSTATTYSAEASSGGNINLTVASSAGFSAGQLISVFANNNGNDQANGNWTVGSVPDGTHIVLQNSVCASCTGAGSLNIVPSLATTSPTRTARNILNQNMQYAPLIGAACGTQQCNVYTLTYDAKLNVYKSQPGGLMAAVPYEAQIHIANLANAWYWPTIPQWATDDFVTQLSTLALNNLNSTSEFCPEWGNEDWNGGFPQYYYSTALGATLGFPSGNGEQFLGWAALRNRQINGNLVPAVWTGSNASRLCRVLAWQAGGDSNILTYLMKGTDLVNNKVYSSAVTMTAGSPGIVNWSFSGLMNGWPITFSTTTGGVSTSTTYYVSNVGPNGSQFYLSTTPGGAPITLTGSGSNTATYTNPYYASIIGTNYNALPNRPMDVNEMSAYAPYTGATHFFYGQDTGQFYIQPSTYSAALYQSVITNWEGGSTAAAISSIDNDIFPGVSASATIQSVSGNVITTTANHPFKVGSPLIVGTAGGAGYSGLTANTYQLYYVDTVPAANQLTMQPYTGGFPSGTEVTPGTSAGGTVTLSWVGGACNPFTSGANCGAVPAAPYGGSVALVSSLNGYMQFGESMAAQFDGNRPAGMAPVKVAWYEGTLEDWPPPQATVTALGLTGTTPEASLVNAEFGWLNSSLAATQMERFYNVFLGKDPAFFTYNAMPHSFMPAQFGVYGPRSFSNSWGVLSGQDGSTPYQLYNGIGVINFLLKRDLDPTSNDNDPMWLEKAA